MKGAIFFASKYGSTAQYAHWIAQRMNLPTFDVKDSDADPSQYDFLVIGSPVLYDRVLARKWVKKNLASLVNRPIIFFTVTGAPAGPKLDKWIANTLPASFVSGNLSLSCATMSVFSPNSRTD